MSAVFEITYTILLFLAIYFQVFFLIIFFENKEKLESGKVYYADNKLPSVSFIIPCFNEEKSVSATIESVLDLDYPRKLLKIIAVDDGSTDNTWEILNNQYKNHPQISLMTQKNAGKSEALNNALKRVETELVVSFDADTEIKSNALREIVAKFVEDSEIMAIGGTVLIHKPKTLVQKAQSVEYKMFSFTKKMLGIIGAVLVVPGAFSIFRKEVFEKIGGYRNAHNLEDVEMTLRMQKHGLKIDHCHTAFVLTRGPDSARKLFKQRIRWCHGFIENFKDYKHMLFNRKYGNFSFFTLPLNLFSYLMIVFAFFIGMWRVSLFIHEKITEIRLVGFQGLVFFNTDLFFVDVRITTLLGLTMFAFILTGIFMGNKTSKTSSNLWSVMCFFSIYSILAPLWVLKSIYNGVLSIQTSWR
jgi:peptidoglycan-N-acetylglucosamine deacetylase